MSQPESDLLEDEDALEALAEFESVTGETSLNEAKYNFKKAKKLVFPNPFSSSPPGVPDRSILFTSEGEHNGHSGFPASSPTNYKSFQTHESDEDDELLVMSVSQNHPMDYESNHQQHSLDLLPPSDVEEFISQGTFEEFNSQAISIDEESIPVSTPTSQLASDLIPMERSSSIDIRPDTLLEKELPLNSTLTDVSISIDTEEEPSKLNTSSIPPQEPKMSTNFLFLSDDEEDDEIPPGQDSHHPNLRNLNTGKLGGLFATNFTQPNLSTFQFPKNPDNKFEDTLDSQNTNVSLFPDSQPSQYSLDSSEISIPVDNKDKGKGKEKENPTPEPTSLFMDIPEDLDDPDLQEMYTYPGESEEYQELLSLEKETTQVNPKKRILDDNDFAISVAELETTGEAIESIKSKSLIYFSRIVASTVKAKHLLSFSDISTP
ncbi:hypothetical protein K7432_015776 [Basidiobolus ranarum]|uniref:Uncharacterized protein n=1 Tax=Basidiobolus ranarum TaxID=34480 RepID=A0ABR2VN91_9FUNG